MTRDDYETLFSYFMEVGIVAQLTSTLFERNLPEGMTRSQFSVLNWFLRVDTVASPGRLATAFQVTRGAMTNTLKKLAAKGYITVEPDSTSGRSKIVRLTALGEAVHERAIASARPAMEDFAGRLDLDCIRDQLENLKSIRKLLDDARYASPDSR